VALSSKSRLLNVQGELDYLVKVELLPVHCTTVALILEEKRQQVTL